MAILKLVGAKRFMNKKASPNVIELNGLTDDIQDKKLIEALLNWRRSGKDNKDYPMFVPYEPEVEKVALEPEPEVAAEDTPEADPETPAEEQKEEDPVTETVKEEVTKPKPTVKKKAAKKKAARTRNRKPSGT